MCGCVAQQVYAGAKDEIVAQRQDYRTALRAIAANDEGSYRAAVKRLHDYPLLPYLEFARLNRPARRRCCRLQQARSGPRRSSKHRCRRAERCR